MSRTGRGQSKRKSSGKSTTDATAVRPDAGAKQVHSVPAPSQPHPPGADGDLYSSAVLGEVIDRSIHAAVARFTSGLSPAALAESYLDWATHLSSCPGKQMQLTQKAALNAVRLSGFALRCCSSGGCSDPCIRPMIHDHRFANEAWQQWPFNLIYQGFLLQQQWWHDATTGVRGVTGQHENAVEFAARQILDVFAPSNFVLTNPELLQQTVWSGGMNLFRGWQNLLEDWERAFAGRGPVGSENFQAGHDVAVTPGKVIYRNRLMELIQYEPATDQVRPEPILIVPAWIMKYYILDLSPHNSLVKYLTEQGFTVFMISWRNPGADDRDLGMNDYRELGILAAIDAVSAVRPDRLIHAVGYCIGGTLLAIAAAAMARDGDDRLGTITLFAAQSDFHEAGELMLFINESQLTFLDDMMWEQGFLDGKQMAGAFQLLRSNDLIWSRTLNEYLMGERRGMIDLMAWNADTTRLPYRMHSEYLRQLYLENELAEGRWTVDGRPITLNDIQAPMFVMGTTRDHVAPWRSVYKIHLLANTEITFLLTEGGHNAGVVSQPGRKNRSYQVMSTRRKSPYIDPDAWMAAAPRKEGSWWPEWIEWLQARSGHLEKPPDMGAPEAGLVALSDAPGLYVHQK